MAGYLKTILQIVLFFLLPLSTFAEPVVKSRSIYYTVSGNTAEEIWADIIKKSPVKHKGRLHVAYTKWNVNWQFWWLDKTNSCEMTRVTTTLDVAYTLPKLKQTSSMPESLISRWEKYNSALFSHEQGHKDLGKKAATDIENAISSMEPRTSCKQLERDANEMGKNIVKKYSRIEQEYDRTTQHGLNTGAVFP